jgi:hypothetical protein
MPSNPAWLVGALSGRKIGTHPILFGIIIVLRKARDNPLSSVNIPHEGL